MPLTILSWPFGRNILLEVHMYGIYIERRKGRREYVSSFDCQTMAVSRRLRGGGAVFAKLKGKKVLEELLANDKLLNRQHNVRTLTFRCTTVGFFPLGLRLGLIGAKRWMA